MESHQYFKSVLKLNDYLEQEVAQLMSKAIVDKQKSFETNFGKMVYLVDLGLVPNSSRRCKIIMIIGEKNMLKRVWKSYRYWRHPMLMHFKKLCG
jgi:hypothetical protein